MINIMKICYFGDYNLDYSRTRVILRGLEECGIPVVHCNARERGLAKYWKLWRAHRALRGSYDMLFVGLGDARAMPIFARLITGGPVVWEPLYSLYDNWVFDRKLASPHSLKAYYYRLLDWLGCKASDLIILDTNTNCEYFRETFGVPKQKLAPVLVGADTSVFLPLSKIAETGKFEVEFHGKYIPVQGTDVIIRAAKLLEGDNVHVTMIGGGQALGETKALAETLGVNNVTFLPFLPQQEVVGYIKNADVCMGLVGDVPRVVRAIPNKMYEAAAMARVSINVDSPALREVFTPGVDSVGVKEGDPEDLARAIRELKAGGKAEAMGKSAYTTFVRTSTPKLVGEELLAALARVAPKQRNTRSS